MSHFGLLNIVKTAMKVAMMMMMVMMVMMMIMMMNIRYDDDHDNDDRPANERQPNYIENVDCLSARLYDSSNVVLMKRKQQ